MLDCYLSTAAVAQWLERSPRERLVVGSIPDHVIPKTLYRMVSDASLLNSAHHIMIGMASLSCQISFKNEMDLE